MENSFISLIAIGILALLGFQHALVLLQSSKTNHSVCGRVNRSPYASIGKLPIAYMAMLLYALILGQLFQIFQKEQIVWKGLTVCVILLLMASGYYAYVLFFKLRWHCWVCIRLHLIHILMGIFLLGHYWRL